MSALRFSHNITDIPAELRGNHVLFERRKAWDTPERGEIVRVNGTPVRIVNVRTTEDGKKYDLIVKEYHEPT